MEDEVLEQAAATSEPDALHRKLLEHLRRHAVRRAGDATLLSPKGQPIRWLVDLKGALLLDRALDDVATLFWREFARRLPFQVGGMEVAAVPIMTAIVMKGIQLGHDINGFIVRKERKKYGMCRSIEGALDDKPIVIVDDITNSGKSLEKVRAVLESEGRTIAAVFSVVDFRSNSGLQWRRRARIPVASLFTPDMLGVELSSGRAGERVSDVVFEPAWKIPLPGGNPFFVVPKSAPVVHDAHLYFGSDAGIFHCVGARDGAVKWSFRCASAGRKGIWSIPRIVGDSVLFGAYDGNTYCLSRQTGEVRWINRDADWIGSSADVSERLGLVFIGFEYERAAAKGGLVALDLRTGEKRWEVPTQEYLHGSPRFEEAAGAVIVGTNDNRVICVDAASGEMRWTCRTEGPVKHGIAIDPVRRVALFGSFDGHLYGVHIDTGAQLMRIDTGNAIYSTPLVYGNRAFVGSSSKNCYAIDLDTLSIEKTIAAGSKVLCSPSLIEGHVYIGKNDGSVVELDAATLDVTASLTVPDAVTNAVAYCARCHLYFVLTAMNQLHAFGRKTRG